MKISHLKIQHFLGIRHFDEALGELNLIAGLNESGKSSVENAIRLAVCGEIPRIELRKELGELVHDGAKVAAIVIDGDPDAKVSITSAGKATGIPNAEDVPVTIQALLNMHYLSGLDQTGLRKALFAISGLGGNEDQIAAALQKADADMGLVASIQPLLTNFEAAEREAETKAKEARGEWKGITGETYGEVKAETWAAKVPETVAVEDRSKELQAKMAGLSTELANMRASGSGRAQVERSHAEAKEGAKEYARHAEAIKALDADILKAKEQVEKLSEAAAGRTLPKMLGMSPCPECGSELAILPDYSLMERGAYEAANAGGPPKGAEGKAKEAKAALALLEKARAVRQQDLEAADKLAKLLPGLETQLAGFVVPSHAQVDAKAAEVEEATKAYTDHVTELADARSAALGAKNATEATAKAAKANNAVKAWSHLRALLSPDGIPAQLIGDLLTKLNDRLRASATATGWGQVQIHPDMQITYGGRRMALISESARWRLDAMLCEAVGYVTAECFLLFDRIDILGIEQRGVLLAWCDKLVDAAHQIILLGTLKQKPTLDDVNVMWLEKGECK